MWLACSSDGGAGRPAPDPGLRTHRTPACAPLYTRPKLPAPSRRPQWIVALPTAPSDGLVLAATTSQPWSARGSPKSPTTNGSAPLHTHIGHVWELMRFPGPPRHGAGKSSTQCWDGVWFGLASAVVGEDPNACVRQGVPRPVLLPALTLPQCPRVPRSCCWAMPGLPGACCCQRHPALMAGTATCCMTRPCR